MVIMSVIGTRPQFIKCALVSKELRSRGITEILVNTGQHYDANMSDIFIRDLEIPHINYNLEVGSGSHAKQTAEIMTALEEVIDIEKPSMGVYYGDTNSTCAAALTFSKKRIPTAHIESGLRSYDILMAEEQNRIIADNLSTIRFAPTDTAVKNLKRENIVKNVFNVGDVMYDNIVRTTIPKDTEKNNYILVTLHRAENVDCAENLKDIFHGFALSRKNIIFPAHPRTRAIIDKNNIIIPYNVHLMQPVSYLKMLELESNAEKIVTDSGGVQKEAYIFGVPCITIRKTTEWTETLRDGMNTLCPLNTIIIADMISQNRKRVNTKRYYGDGNAHKKIADILEFQKWE